ncbi:MAG: VanZ family protein [Muribaculaceae bacterium]
MRRFLRNLPVGVASGIVTLLVIYFSLSAHPIGADQLIIFEGADKILHFIMYFGLSAVYYLDYAKFRLPHHTRLNAEAGVTTAAIVLGGLMEIAQGFTGKRQMDFLDFLANTAGAIAAFLFIKYYFMNIFRSYFLHKRHHHRHHSTHSTANEKTE